MPCHALQFVSLMLWQLMYSVGNTKGKIAEGVKLNQRQVPSHLCHLLLPVLSTHCAAHALALLGVKLREVLAVLLLRSGGADQTGQCSTVVRWVTTGCGCTRAQQAACCLDPG
jgi:hypothetical protein